MDKQFAVTVENVSMHFNMASEKIESAKEYFIKLVKHQLFYKDFVALDNISFNVKKGEIFGIVGTNGSGKSTLLKLIAGIMEPTKGRIVTAGKIAPLIELGAGFDGDLTARENIFLNGAILGYEKQFIEEKFSSIVDFAELWDFLDMPIKNYSSGMVARIAFAIATVVKPDILIVDEILAVGDFLFQQKCENRIRELIEGGTTVLFVSHSIDQIEKICDRVLWIEKGQFQMIGRTFDVCNAYRNLQSSNDEEKSLQIVAKDHCWICGNNVPFRLEQGMVLFREAMCQHCGSSIRISDLGHVLLDSFGVEKDSLQSAVARGYFDDYHILSSNDGGTIHACLNQLPYYTALHGSDSEKLKQLVKLNFKDTSLDAILVEELLAYAPNPDDLFKEFQRVLKPGGVLLITVPIHEGSKTVNRIGNPRKVYRGQGMLVTTDWGEDIIDCLEQAHFSASFRKEHLFYAPNEITRVDSSYHDCLNKHPFYYYKYNSIVVVAKLEDYK